ncbi:phospholipase B1, membrane-associated-like [Clupea harengus]|uniref:Phospholipase B1, membrane-associated n=1 Tax=Clupea harengus TaxID=7950 RepID=A0A6P8GFS7_CLUHA|nr:phospholipase B1, membrane-associated-like [Clupea harengus]
MDTSGQMMMLKALTLLGLFLASSVSALATKDSAQNLICTTSSRSLTPPTSAHSLRPGDVTQMSALAIPHPPQTDVSRLMDRMWELMSMFSPGLINPSNDKSLHVNAEEMIEFLNHQELDDWKLVLLFVQMDSLCVCPEQVSNTVQVVEKTIGFLHSQLKKTIVSVMVWDSSAQPGYLQHSRACPCSGARAAGELRLLKAVLPQVLQEALHRHLVDKKFYSDREDFTVVLQNAPVFSHLPGTESGHYTVDESLHTNKLAVQLWANLLQPAEEQRDMDDTSFGIPCPSEEHPYLRTERNSPSESYVSAAAPAAGSVMGTEMPCMDRSPSPVTPTSVHEIRPADLRVVAAIGDSLTAGNGVGATNANNLLQVLVQYRGLSWSVGGDKNLSSVTTLPNILKEFNANVTGFSEDKGKENTPQAFLNQAVAGSKANNLIGQARALVNRMKTDTRVNFHTDWKVITVFIGGNDLCDYCSNALVFSPDNFVRHIREALDFLHKEVPRAIVNLIEPIHITPLRRMHQEPSIRCPTWLVNIICPCVVGPKQNSDAERRLNDLNRLYQRAIHELIESERYDTHDNFTVVIQPFLREIVLPVLPDGRPDRSYFSPDCFHLSQRAHTQMARALWNNMLEPLGNKTHIQDFTAGLKLTCPSQSSPFMRTYKNSNYTYQGPKPTPPPTTEWGRDFSCKSVAPSASVPTSAHKLRPADIKVVAALGDSITAGRAAKAKTYNDLKKEYRGVSWSIGGDNDLKTITTLPNILKNFNPSIQGFSKGQGSFQKGFNMAVSGAQASEIPAQIRSLIQAMKTNNKVNYAEDWKLVTLFVGVGDLCHYCKDQNNLSSKNFTEHLIDSLDLLYGEVPRVLVNILEVPQIDLLKKINKGTLTCSFLPRETCPCVIVPDENSPELMELKRVNVEYQAALEQLVSGGRYDEREDFALVLQPFLLHPMVPLVGVGQPDLSYFSLDCVHLSEKTHSEMATALWNNMLEPVGRKHFYTNFTYDRTKIHCPSEAQPFIFTHHNSQPSPVPVTTPGPTSTPRETTSAPPVPSCPASVPVWVPVVLAITGLLIGWGLTWMVFSRQQRRMLKSMKTEGKDTDKKETGL